MKQERQRVEAVEGEYGFDFKFYLKDADGDAVTDLAGTEVVTLWLQKDGGSAFSVGTGSVYDTATGELHVRIASGDVTTLTEGVYLGQVEIQGAASRLITMDVEVEIVRRLGS